MCSTAVLQPRPKGRKAGAMLFPEPLKFAKRCWFGDQTLKCSLICFHLDFFLRNVESRIQIECPFSQAVIFFYFGIVGHDRLKMNPTKINDTNFFAEFNFGLNLTIFDRFRLTPARWHFSCGRAFDKNSYQRNFLPQCFYLKKHFLREIFYWKLRYHDSIYLTVNYQFSIIHASQH